MSEFKINAEPKRTFVDADGEEHTKCKNGGPVSAKKIQFFDDGSAEKDKEFTRQVKFSVSERTRKNNEIIKDCEVCKKPFKAVTAKEYRCTECCKR